MLFRNKYRIETARCPKWDYSSPGYYFVTIVTQDRGHLFGKILRGEMRFNQYGKIVHDEWLRTFEIRSELHRDEFIVMPNHLHGIIRISVVETRGRASLRERRESQCGIAFRAPRSISSFIGGYKSSVTKRINKLRNTPGARVFQPRFHDRIIRNEKELFLIRRYIRNNPANWENDDEFNGDNSKTVKTESPGYVRMPQIH